MLTFNHLENFIQNMAPLHYACDNAPNDYKSLKRWERSNLDNDCPVMPVYNGGCDNTIWSKPEINYAFRAWHDTIHLEHGYDFTVYGEIMTCRQHMQVLRENDLGHFVDILWCEIVGQVLYYARKKKYVKNQREFVLLLLANRVKVNDIGKINDIINRIGDV